MNKALTVEIWSDLICPWCWIGKRRFERALDQFPRRDQVQVRHRSFRLMPGLPPQPVETMMSHRFGSSVQIEAMLGAVERTAAEEGLIYHLNGTLVGDTLDAHRLVHLAHTDGLVNPLVERFYRGYLSEHESLFDRETLLRHATEVGIPRTDALRVLDSTAYVQEVEKDQRAAQALGARGVPFFWIDGRVPISGGQSSEEFLSGLSHAWNTGSVSSREQDMAAVCRPDGCSVV